MFISSKNYSYFSPIVKEQFQSPSPQQSIFVDSSLLHAGQNADDSKGCWESFTDLIKTIADWIVAIFCCICCKNDQISDDGRYTIAGYDELRKCLKSGDRWNLMKCIHSESFKKIYFMGDRQPVIVPRLDFFQLTTYSEDEFSWIESFVTDCLGFPRRCWTSDDYSFLEAHIHAYVYLIMGMEISVRNKILNNIIDLIKSKTQLTGNAVDNFGYGVRMMLNDMNARPTFKEFYQFVYPPINEYIVKNVSTI